VTTPRRRVLRGTAARAPAATTPVNSDAPQQVRAQRRRAELAQSRTALRRWLTRLKRATNTVVNLHQRIARLEAARAAD
jgi:hypothetical protein